MSTMSSLIARSFTGLMLMVALSGTAAAQAIPDNIPDGTPSVPEQQREQLKERHRDVVSRFFTGANLSAAPAFNQGLTAYSAQVEFGFDVARHNILYLTLGARQHVVDDPEATGWFGAQKETAALVAVHYDLGLARFVEASTFSRRAAIGLGLGAVVSENLGMLTVEVAPKYVLPINRYWSLPVGLKIGQAVIGGRGAQVRTTFVGLSIGVKRFFGHRDHLKSHGHRSKARGRESGRHAKLYPSAAAMSRTT